MKENDMSKNNDDWRKAIVDNQTIEVRVVRGRTELKVNGRDIDPRSKEATNILMELHNRGLL